MTLGLCMIVKDEEEVLARCLDSCADAFDEIVVADTGSSDGTKEIAKRYTDKVFDVPWQNDFAAARNAAFSRAESDYLMWLDADDILTPKDRAALCALKAELDGTVDAYFLPYDLVEAGRVAMTLWRERIVRRACGFSWAGYVHEAMQVHGRLSRADVHVTHRRSAKPRTGRNLFLFARAFADGRMPDVRQKFYFARELLDNGLYETAASVYESFLSDEGCAQDRVRACLDLSVCRKAAGDREGAKRALFQSFSFAPPCSEACCALGDLHREAGDYPHAVFYYKLALNEAGADGFDLPDCRGFLPWIWLCVCYDRMGDFERARRCNEKAGEFRPDDPAYLHNKLYFEKRSEEKKT